MRYGKPRQQSVSDKTLFISMVLLGFIVVLSSSHAWADDVSCGDTIGDGQNLVTLTLDGDLDCSKSPGTALTLNGPVRLNLNGFQVIGAGSSYNGIVVQGRSATILNGTVRGASIGIYLRGDGYHQILNVTVKHCESRGIRVRSGNNWLINNYIENSSKGIRVDDGSDYNTIIGNTMVNNESENCDVQGSNNVLANNIAKSRLKLKSEECFLIGDLENGQAAADDNLVMNNTALYCKGGGFVAAQGTSRNYFVNNTALGNSPFDLTDYSDAEENCEDDLCCSGNTWTKNTAKSGDPRCILRIRRPWTRFQEKGDR